jgi:glycosyltransferase involved in cell wall biosynthesis
MTPPRPLTILYHHRTQGGGVEGVHIRGVANAWRRQGHRVEIAGPPGTDPDSQSTTSASRPTLLARLAKHAPRLCFELMEVAYSLVATWGLWRRLRRSRYDLVYERFAFMNIAGALASRWCGVPFVVEVNYTSATLLVRNRSPFAKALDRWAERIVVRRADAFVVVSSKLRDLLLGLGVPEWRILMSPNAADPEAFDPSRSPDALRAALGLGGGPIVGFVGHFYPWHRVDLLVDAYQAVHRAVPEVTFLLVGDGPTRADVASAVEARGWQAGVLLPGRVAHADLPDYVALFDVAVVPDTNDYGSPMKIAEYMAAGRPTVAPRVGPVVDMVRDGQTGVLFEPRNSAQLAEALIGLLTSPERRTAIGRAARLHVEQVLNWDAVALKILALTETVTGTHAEGAR